MQNTCIFCELNMKTRKSLRVVSLSASSLQVYLNLLSIFARLNPVLQTKDNARPAVVRSP